MTSPTGPDRDRLRASDAGQDECDHFMHSVVNKISGEAVCQACGLHWQYGAPQQPPAQERPEPGSEAWGEMIAANKAAGWHCGRGLAEGYCDNPDHARKGAHPPSEADSAGEVERLARVLAEHTFMVSGRITVGVVNAWCVCHGWRTESVRNRPDSDWHTQWRRHVASHLAASSGVRGGDDQARERLADVLAAVDNLAERGALHLREGQSGKWKKRLSETLRTRGETQIDAADFIRRAAGGGQ